MPEQRGSPSSKGHPLDEDADDAECSKCSPVFHGGPLTSPIGRIEEKVDDPLQMKIRVFHAEGERLAVT